MGGVRVDGAVLGGEVVMNLKPVLLIARQINWNGPKPKYMSSFFEEGGGGSSRTNKYVY